MQRFLPLFLFTGITACVTVSPLPNQATTGVTPPPMPVSPVVPYPQPDLQDQINQLKRELIHLQNQINRLQKNLPTTKPTTTRKKNAPKRTPKSLTKKPPATTHTIINNIPPEPQPDNTLLYQAHTQYQQGNYAEAIKILRQANRNGHITNPQNMFLLLQSHQKLKHCESVIQLGQRYLTTFRASPEAAEALWMIGQCQWNMQQRDIARDTWRKLIHVYPDSMAAKRAAQHLK